MPNDNEKQEVTVSLSPKVLALLGLEKDAKAETIKERIENLDKNPTLYHKTPVGTIMAGFDAEADEFATQAVTGIIPKGKTDFVDLSLVEVPNLVAVPNIDLDKIHFRLYEDPYMEDATYTSSMQQEDLLEATKDFEDAPERETSVGRCGTYDPKTSLLALTIEENHVTSVSYNEKYQMPQAHLEAIGAHTTELDLSEKGTKAKLHSETGETTITIRSPRPDEDVLLQESKTTLVVGDIGGNGHTGKEALKAYLEEDHPKDDIVSNRLASMIERIAQKQKIAPLEPDISKEMESIMKRPGFTYGKRYPYLYDAGIRPAYHAKPKQAAR